jgi:(1->4)-alpha-D-glucan 1-alpha-D-glucosylmutase
LISRNDVGFDPRRLAYSAAEFHRKMQARNGEFPHAMLATATHDHKRGEDVRARLAVLSEIPEYWTQALEQWLDLSASHRKTLNNMPTMGDAAIFFQTIVGAWPDGLTHTDQQGLAAYSKRLISWQVKAVREAKLHSDWAEPNEAYETAVSNFIEWIFTESSELLTEIAEFVWNIRAAGAAKSLAQTLLKLTAPGVPDFYQGTEYWDFSLVDPDNRSLVDFMARRASLDALPPRLPSIIDGHIKQLLIARVLAVRKKVPHLFSIGHYRPVEIVGAAADSAIGFARVLHDFAAIILVYRRTAQFFGSNGVLNIPSLCGTGVRLLVPPEMQGIFSNVLLVDESVSIGPEVDVGQIMRDLPVALLIKTSNNQPTTGN